MAKTENKYLIQHPENVRKGSFWEEAKTATGSQTGNQYPFQASTIYPGVSVTIENDAQFISYLGNPDFKAELSADALVQYFFPKADEQKVREIVFRLGITGKDPAEVAKVRDYMFQQRDKDIEDQKQTERDQKFVQNIIAAIQKPREEQAEIKLKKKKKRRNLTCTAIAEYLLMFGYFQEDDILISEYKNEDKFRTRRKTICNTIHDWENGKSQAPDWYAADFRDNSWNEARNLIKHYASEKRGGKKFRS